MKMEKITPQEELEKIAALLGWRRCKEIEEDDWHSCSLSERRQRLNAMVDNKEKLTPEQVDYLLSHHLQVDDVVDSYTAFDLADIRIVFNRNNGGVSEYIKLDSDGLTIDEFICNFKDIEIKVAGKDLIVGIIFPGGISMEEREKVGLALNSSVSKCRNRTVPISLAYIDSCYIQIFVF